MTYDVTVTSLLKRMGNLDLAKQDKLYIIRKLMKRALRRCNFY